MTRLTQNDLLDCSFENFTKLVRDSLGTAPLNLCQRAWDLDSKQIQKLYKRKLAAITISSGDGPITGFAQKLTLAGEILGLDSKVMEKRNAKGFKEAQKWGADIIIASDDKDFVAQEKESRIRIHNNPATARIFVAALEFLTKESLRGKKVLVLGLGPVGFFASSRLLELGAHPVLYDTDTNLLFAIKPFLKGATIITEEDQLRDLFPWENPLIFEAVPKRRIFSKKMERLIFQSSPKVAAPGVPLSWPTEWLKNSQKSLSPGLFHEPLIAGTIAMLSGLASQRNRDFGEELPKIVRQKILALKGAPGKHRGLA
jgi:hypothetical protein